MQESFPDRELLEEHASQTHQITREGLQKLASLVEGCQWLTKARTDHQLRTPSKEEEENSAEEIIEDSEGCVVSEKHAYKYRCSQCSLAFKTQDKLETHSQYHLIRDASKCRLCERSFRTVQALLKHLETGHPETGTEELTQYKLGLMTNPLLLAGMTGPALGEMLTDSDKVDNNVRRDLSCVKLSENDSITKDQMETIVRQAKKVDKVLNYPLEKYLDPNRPFKCEVCKESFTQKNILLVHFNSVSHLHKLKKVMKEQQENNPSLALTPHSEKSSPSLSSPQPGTALLSVLGSLNAKKQLEPDDEVKPYRCNICRVSYSQASNLDIHVRSVLHSSRASKLQELVMMGQVDLSKPLIEQPEMTGQENSLLSPQSLISNSSSSPLRTSTPTKRSLAEVLAASPEVEQDHQLSSFIQSTLGSNQSEANSTSTTFNPEIQSSPLVSVPEGKKSSHVLKSLLQNYGFELVMQFNESHQRRKLEERLRLEKEILNSKSDKKPNEDEMETDDQKSKKDEGNSQLPELKKSNCPICQKEFSSIWVLKAHTEEVHKFVVPQNVVQKYIEELRSGPDTEPASHPPEDRRENDTEQSKNISQDESSRVEIGEKSEERAGGETGQQSQQPEEGVQNFMKEALKMMQHHQTLNLHPPLLPPGGPNDQLAAALLLQAQLAAQKKSQVGVTPFEQQILKKLGIDPEAVKQAGLDPKFLVHLANMDPKAAQDPKLSAMMMQAPEFPLPLGSFHTGKMGLFPPVISPHHEHNLFSRNPQQFVDQNKRARTRITDDQLKILRANFDINNSPSDEQINLLVAQTGLPPKVIKHWYRNTLFKERQRNKDSPYNFNNPPSTVLNIEEYEKTGESKVTPLSSGEKNGHSVKGKELIKLEDDETGEERRESKDEGKEDLGDVRNQQSEADLSRLEEIRRLQMSLGLNVTSGQENNSNPSPVPFDAMFSSQMNLLEKHPLLHSPLAGTFPSPLSFMPSPGPVFPPGFPAIRDPSPHPDHPGLAHSPNSKRANRTRFTDYQIKVLQEFFENNAYPKDDDLEYLSKLLALSPRVIVVWFQNARQKARKIYENQPSLDPEDEGAGRFTRTPGLNYQCKKCLLVFQRYYELNRHQKQHCFKEEDAKRSAQAQAAAAHAAATFVNQSGSLLTNRQEAEPGGQEQILSPVSLADIRRSTDSDSDKTNQGALPIHLQRLIEEKKQFGTMFEKFSQEERVMKFINENTQSGYPLSAQFAMLQKQAAGLSDTGRHEQDSDDQSIDSFISSPSSKRKLSDDNDDLIERDENGQPKDKRLRTTILPEQLDYLYQKYQVESNPSRKMLEQFAGEVGLRKRVVQVWFQNTRARERKGQYRAHQQVINKRCPFCPALFKVRSALESHLATKHVAQYSKGDINIDNLPDAAAEEPITRSTLFPSIPVPTSPQPQPTNEKSVEFEASMRKYYEDTMKQFINDVNKGRQTGEALDLSSAQQSDKVNKQEVRVSPGSEATDSNQIYEFEDDPSQDMENYSLETEAESDQLLPAGDPKKRCRTQMTATQVKLMKHVFLYQKMPSMADCSRLAEVIGLQKRVVQVWFQNARSKDKKARAGLSESSGEEIADWKECKFCQSSQFSDKFQIFEHIFSSDHIEKVRLAIQRGEYDPPSPGVLRHGPEGPAGGEPPGGRAGGGGEAKVESRSEVHQETNQLTSPDMSGHSSKENSFHCFSYQQQGYQGGGYPGGGFPDQYCNPPYSQYQQSYPSDYPRYGGPGDSLWGGVGGPGPGYDLHPSYPPCLPQVSQHNNHYQMYQTGEYSVTCKLY